MESEIRGGAGKTGKGIEVGGGCERAAGYPGNGWGVESRGYPCPSVARFRALIGGIFAPLEGALGRVDCGDF